MNELKVSSLPLREVIRDLADAMGTDYHESCDTFSLSIPDRLGTGSIEAINFKDGLGIIHYQCKFHEDTKFSFTLSKVHPLKFLFCYKGKLRHQFSNEEEVHQIDTLQNAIVASKGTKGHVIYFNADTEVNLFSLEVIRSEFANKLDCDISNLNEETAEMFQDITANKTFYYQGYYSLKIINLISKINKTKEKGFLYKIYLEAKAYQFLLEQIKLFEDQDNNHLLFGKYDLQQIKKITNYIEENINQSLKLKELAKKFGLNQNKLQHGFKTLLNQSVNSYIQSKRVEKAAELLSKGNYSVAEISEKVGLKSKSYFTKIFKKNYGISPKTFQLKRSKELIN
jgi:AraC-like DNA-binding protein